MPFVPVPPDTEKWIAKRPCTHPEHDPPKHIVLKPGPHIWKCPACGEEIAFIVPSITC